MRPYSKLRNIGGGPATDRPGRRSGLLASGALHLLVLLALFWFATRPPADPAAPRRGESLIALGDSSGERKPVPPPRPVRRPAHAVARTTIPVLAEPDLEPAGAAGQECALAQQAAEAIERDPVAMAELAALPPGVRSPADAVMLWNGEWLNAGALPAGIDPDSLRRVVEQVVAAAPAECRETVSTGPQFIPVPEKERTTMLVIGSGAWRWSDLTAAPAQCPAQAGAVCPPVPSPATIDGATHA